MSKLTKDAIERTVARRILQNIHKDFINSPVSYFGRPICHNNVLKNAFLGNDIHGNCKEYIEANLGGEIEASVEMNEEEYNDFISFSGYLDGNKIDGEIYLNACGYKQLPLGTVLSIQFNSSNSTMIESDYKQHVQYYKLNFTDEYDPYIFDRGEAGSIHYFGVGNFTIVSKMIRKFKLIKLMGYIYNSKETVTSQGSYINAYYKTGITEHQIQYFFRHDFAIKGEGNVLCVCSFTLAYVCWCKKQDSRQKITTFDSINSSFYQTKFGDDSVDCRIWKKNLE